VQASQKAQEQEEVTNRLNQALKTQGIYTAQTSKALLEQASALQKITTFGDEAIISLQAQLISFGVLPKDIERVTKATLDLAVAQGMDLGSAGNLLAKSLGSSTNALARYGIEITGAVGSSERLDTAITNISTKFGGQATARTETMRGATEQLKNTWGDLQETIMTTNNNAITPYIKGLNDILLKTNEIIKSESNRKGGLALLSDLHKNMAIDLKKVSDGTLENAKALEQENLARLKSEEAKYKEGSFAKRAAKHGIEQSEARIKAIDDEEKRRSSVEQNAKKRAEEAKKRAEELKNQQEEEKQIAQEKEERIQANSLAQMQSVDDLGRYIINSIKRRAIAEMTIEEEKSIGKIAMEIATAIASLDFGKAAAGLGQLAVPAATAAAKIGAINAVQLADGAVVKAQQGGVTGSVNGLPSTVAENRSDEAIIPLEDDARVKELMGGGQTVVNLIVDGQRLAQAVVNGYNKGRAINTVTKIKEQ